MLRIYLDQFAWIGLSRAAHKRPDGAKYAPALEMCRAAKQMGLASFPLDLYRYWETAKNSNDGSRNRLVDLLVELSDFDSMAMPQVILDREIDLALSVRFGRPIAPSPPRVFGRGIAHMSNGRVTDTARPGAATTSSSSDLRVPVDRALEEALLRAGPKEHARSGAPIDIINWGDLYAQQEVRAAQDIAHRKVRREDLLAAVVQTDYQDLVGAVRARLEAAGITAEEAVETLGDKGLLRFVYGLPTRRVANQLRVSKHIHPPQQQKWKPSDFVDVIALPVPVVYCDVVFTEHEWVRALTRDKTDLVHERYDTALIHEPHQLTDLLSRAALGKPASSAW